MNIEHYRKPAMSPDLLALHAALRARYPRSKDDDRGSHGEEEEECEHGSGQCRRCGGRTRCDSDHSGKCTACDDCEYKHPCPDCDHDPKCEHDYECGECDESYDL